MNKFQLDIITPIGIQSYNDVSYIRVPGLDGLLGIQAKHASAIIALTIGEIKITNNNKSVSFATSGGFVDIRPEGIQLLIETIELSKNIDKKRSEKAIGKAQEHLKNKNNDLNRAHLALLRAKNRLNVVNKN